MDEDKLLQKMENRIIKKIKVEDIFLLVFGGKRYDDAKLIIKSLKENERKHLTLKFTKNGFVDIHETVEGIKKKYRPLAKIKIKDFSDALMEKLSVILSKSEINVDSSKFKDYILLIPRNKHARDELLFRSAEIRKKEAIIDRRKLKSAFEESYIVSTLREARNYDFDWAFIYVPDEPSSSGILVKSNKRCFLITSNKLERCLEDMFRTRGLFT